MTKKEFASHDWKVGDILYVIGYKRYNYIKIPICVTRVKVNTVESSIFYVSPLNNKLSKYLSVWGYFRKSGFRQNYGDIFFDRESAYSAFEKKKQEFAGCHKERCRESLKRRLRELDYERSDIYSLFRMNIMRDGL